MPNELIQEQNIIELNNELESKLVPWITTHYTQWMEDLQPHVNKFDELFKHIFIDTATDEVKDDKAYIMPGIYKRFMTYIAHMVSNVYPSPEASFDVQGEDFLSSKSVSKQKSLLAKELKNMDYYQIIAQYLFYRALKGEVVRYITWEKKTKKVRRKLSFLEKQYNKIASLVGMESNKEKFKIVEVPAYEGCKITVIDPHKFVFDKNQKYDWVNCPKIYPTLATFEEIKQNQAYSNYEELESLENQSGHEKETENSTPVAGENISTQDGKIVLLHFWGSLKLDDGTVLTDYYIVLAGNKKIIRFEPNSYPFCPIRRSSFLDNPKTGRSISMFDCAVPLNQYNSELFQDAQRCAGLVVDRPSFGPEGLLPEKQIEIKRGMYIGLKKDSLTDGDIEFMDYAPGLAAIVNLMPISNQEIESATGIFDNMLGQDVSGGRTATEMSMVGSGQEKRMLNEVKDFTRELIIKDIEDIAELNAGYRIEPVPVRTAKTGGFGFDMIKEEDWLGNYSYSYGDALSTLDRKQKLNENMSILKEFLMLPPIQAELGGGMLELLKWTLEQMGMDNADQLIETMRQETQAKMGGMINGQPGQVQGPPIPGIDPNGGMEVPPGAMPEIPAGSYPQGF